MSRRHKGQLGSATTLNIPLQLKTRIPNRFTSRLQNKIFRNTVLMSLSAFTYLLQCCVAGLSLPNIHAHPTKITQRTSMHNMLRFFKTCRNMHRPYQKGKRAALQNMPATHLRTPRRLQRPRCPRGRSCFLVLRRLPCGDGPLTGCLPATESSSISLPPEGWRLEVDFLLPDSHTPVSDSASRGTF